MSSSSLNEVEIFFSLGVDVVRGLGFAFEAATTFAVCGVLVMVLLLVIEETVTVDNEFVVVNKGVRCTNEPAGKFMGPEMLIGVTNLIGCLAPDGVT